MNENYECANTLKNELASTENGYGGKTSLTVTIFNLKYLLGGGGRK
jgi:hypothetical protein